MSRLTCGARSARTDLRNDKASYPRLALLLAGSLALFTASVAAQHGEAVEGPPEAHSEAPSPESHHNEHARHGLGIFVGRTSEDTREGRRKGTTLGVEYAYRINPDYGVGFILERVLGDFDEDIVVVPVAAYQGLWKFYAGPGFEYADGDYEPLLRFGVERAFEWRGFEIGPQLNVDFVEEERIIVFGVTFSQRF